MTRHVRAAIAVPAIACLLLVAACSGDDEAPTADPSAPAETTAAVEIPNAEVMAEEPARPADERSPAGAIAFGTYVAQTVMHASSQNAHETLRALDVAGDCTTCQQLAEVLETAEESGARQTFADPPRPFDVQVAERGRGESTWIVIVPLERPTVTEYDAAGEVVEEYPASVVVMEMGIKWVDGKWQLFNYRYADDEENG